MHLLLICQGQTSFYKSVILTGRANNPGLDLDGQGQGGQLAGYINQFFPQLHFDAIYASPLPRAKQTAEILSTALTIPLFVDDNLKDINIGDWADQSSEVVNSVIGERNFLDLVGVQLANGEEIVEVLTPGLLVIERLRSDFINSSAIVVFHLNLNKLIVAHYIRQSLYDLHTFETIPTAPGLMRSFSQHLVRMILISVSSKLAQLDLEHSYAMYLTPNRSESLSR